MSYHIVGSPWFFSAGANRNGHKQAVVDGLQKIFAQQAREAYKEKPQQKVHVVVVPTLLTVHSTEFMWNVGHERQMPGRGILLFGCLTDCATPLTEKQVRAELLHELAHKRVTFEYVACSWPSDKEGNGASGIGFFLTLAHRGEIDIERIIKIAEDMGERLGGLRHLYVLGTEPLVLERYSPLN